MLLHETGHLFGLPDLYLFPRRDQVFLSPADWLNPVGAWDIMCDLDLGHHFLGWHKYKLGWLDESQLFYLKSSEVLLPLAPFESAEGVKMILLPSESESKVYVVEIAQPLGKNQEYRDKGILVYTVDAAVKTGERPVSVVSGLDENPSADETGKYGVLCLAYLAPGETQAFNSGSQKIEITNEKRSGSGFQVRARQFATTKRCQAPRRSRNPGKGPPIVLASLWSEILSFDAISCYPAPLLSSAFSIDEDDTVLDQLLRKLEAVRQNWKRKSGISRYSQQKINLTQLNPVLSVAYRSCTIAHGYTCCSMEGAHR